MPVEPAVQSVQSAQSAQRKVGLMVLGSSVVVVVLLALATSASRLGLLPHKITVTTYFADSAGLKSGAAVTLNGVSVGTVKSVTLTSAPEHKKAPVQVVMRLDSKYQPSLHTDSLATLVSLGALADPSVDIDSERATGGPLEDGDELKTLNTPSVLDLKAGQATVKNLNEVLGRFNNVVDQIETGNGTIGQFMINPSLPNDAAVAVEKVQKAAAKLDGTSNTAGKLLHDHDIYDKFSSIAKNAQGITAGVAKVNGELAPLQANLATAGTHANSLIADLNAGKGGVGMLLNNPAVSKQLADTGAKANALISGYGKNPATGGNFAAGGATTIDLQKFQAETAALTTMMRQDPKKVFSIEVRIF